MGIETNLAFAGLFRPDLTRFEAMFENRARALLGHDVTLEFATAADYAWGTQWASPALDPSLLLARPLTSISLYQPRLAASWPLIQTFPCTEPL